MLLQIDDQGSVNQLYLKVKRGSQQTSLVHVKENVPQESVTVGQLRWCVAVNANVK